VDWSGKAGVGRWGEVVIGEAGLAGSGM